MRRIAIVGAGQSGLQLGLGLLRHGYQVTLLSARTPEEIEGGRVTSSQCMFGSALAIERALGLNLWDEQAPAIRGMTIALGGDEGALALRWSAPLDLPAQSVDQRLKNAAWLRLVPEWGGDLRVQTVDVNGLETLAREHDLVVVAAGRATLDVLFEPGVARTPFLAPQRALALTYLHGMAPAEPYTAVDANFLPGVGELFVVPALTLSGPCDILVFEGVPGGPLDSWSEITSPEEHLAHSLALLERFVPWEAARCGSVSLTDANGLLAGRFPPVVRQPVGRLPSGALVLGLGDTVVLNDPITGQGSNNAAKAADSYLHRIIAQGERPFDAAWMQATFDEYWDYAQWVSGWTNAMLLPPPPHVQKLLGAAASVPGVAAAIVNGFDHPPSLYPWMADPDEADRFIEAGGRRAPAATKAAPLSGA